MALKVHGPTGLEVLPGGAILKTADKAVLARSTGMPVGQTHAVKKHGVYHTTRGGVGTTRVRVPRPSEAGGQIVVVNVQAGALEVSGEGATINGAAAAYDATTLAAVTLIPGDGDDWIVLPHAVPV